MSDVLTTEINSIAVLIAAHNAESTIARAVVSALRQTEVTEVIVVDDYSTDGTVSVAKSADDGTNRLQIFLQPNNLGPSAARNRAISESKAPWVAILDADDFFLPGRIARLLNAVEMGDLIADDAAQVSEQMIDGPRRSLLGPRFGQARTISFCEFVLSNVTKKGVQRAELGFIKPIIRRQFLEKNKMSYPEQMRLGEDFELYARALALGGRLYIIPEVGYISVVREGSLSGRHSEEDLRHLRDCDEQLRKLPGLSRNDRDALRDHYLSVDCRLQWRLLITAIKARDVRGALETFLRPWPVPLYLIEKLVEQLVLRTAATLRKSG